MKIGERSKWVLLCLVLLGLLVPSIGYSAPSEVVENISRKIVFQRDNDLFIVGENGEGLTRLLPNMDIFDIKWGNEGTTFMFEGAGRQEIGFYDYVFEESGKLLSKLRKPASPSRSYTWPSPRGNFYVEVTEYSEPLWTIGLPDTFIHQVLVKRKNGELIGELSQRAYVGVTWSDREDKLVFFTMGPDCADRTKHCQQFVNVYSLETGSITQFEGLINYPLSFLKNGSKLFYFPINNIPGIADLETGQTTMLEGIEMYYPSEGIPEGMFKLAEAGTKVVFGTVSFNAPQYKLRDGVYVYDIETGRVTNLALDSISKFDLVGETVAYSGYRKPGLFVTSLNGGVTQKIVSGNVDGIISIQPRIPAHKYKNRRVLVLAQGIGTQILDGSTPEDILPELWPIIREAVNRGIYQDVIVYSYSSGQMEGGSWVPNKGDPDASFQSIQASVLTFVNMLSKYATVHRGVTYDFLGHSLGGKVMWESLKLYLNIKPANPPDLFSIGKVITLAAPINGRHRDTVLDLVVYSGKGGQLSSQASLELDFEALDGETQLITEMANRKALLEAESRGINIDNLGSSDDCVVPQLGFYPYNSAVVQGFGSIYLGLGRDKSVIEIQDCQLLEDSIFDIDDYLTAVALAQNLNKEELLLKATGHDRIYKSLAPWLDVLDILLFNEKPRRWDFN
ncbi:MAG: hypothetical protein A3J50_03155 [Candidatus Woykebacteria bacterium RIFCSPHIGHO2_02_FULL_43_16b]|uniref:Uncharacterized protein n=1 Tax=Candidatus Woykebacteria bacterium RIFCSPHIGHO2_02_FULL_43_16b TaxID=1802601 RepID=A0A1G1WP35_9BACT|nr:MAG: hypothetical protein A3J50_03155 [Candidatus Woykebacteria bacterium RIFCSPHIGHO2_02_FULL_43_16b]